MLIEIREIRIVALSRGSLHKIPPHASCDVILPAAVAATQKIIAVFSMAKRREKPGLFLKSEVRLNKPTEVNKKRPVIIRAPWRYINFKTGPNTLSSGESKTNRIPTMKDSITLAGKFLGFTITLCYETNCAY